MKITVLGYGELSHVGRDDSGRETLDSNKGGGMRSPFIGSVAIPGRLRCKSFTSRGNYANYASPLKQYYMYYIPL